MKLLPYVFIVLIIAWLAFSMRPLWRGRFHGVAGACAAARHRIWAIWERAARMPAARC